MKELDACIDAYHNDFDYAFDNNIILNWYPQRILSRVSRNNNALELGIGHGFTSNHFSNYFSKHSVIDGSHAIIKKFRQEYPNSKAQLIQSYFENFESSIQFDVLIMGFVLEHVNDPAHILKRFKKFISPKGRCFIAVPNGEALNRRFGYEAGLLPDLSALGEGDKALGHQRLYTVDSLTTQLQECGYRVISKEGIFLKPLTTKQLISLDLSKDIIQAMCKVGINYPELSVGLFFEVELVK
jgi:2-polyprenyl-3-methyl-5-hydroxy-6-metoxy-1,4-benzoquinol methylase